MSGESAAAVRSGPRRWATAPSLRSAGFATGILLLVGLYWAFGLQPLWAALAAFHPAPFVAYLAAAGIVRVGYSLRWRLVASRLGAVPGLATFLSARLAGDAVSALAPVGRLGGDPVRIGLLYGEGVGGTSASAGVVVDRIIETIGNSCAAVAYVAVCALAYSGAAGSYVAPAVTGALLPALLALVLLLAQWHRGLRPLTGLATTLGLARRRRLARWLLALRQTEDDLVRVCGKHPALLLGGLAGSLAIEVVVIVEHYCLFRAFGVSLELPSLLLVLLATGLSRVAPVPAGLGAMEATQVAVLTATSGRPDVGLVIATLLRLHECLWFAVGCVALSARGVSLMRLRALWWTARTAT